jgi:hypothetical protein
LSYIVNLLVQGRVFDGSTVVSFTVWVEGFR